MNYRKALQGHAFSKQNNRDSVIVAPQGLDETSCDPNYKKFTVVKRAKKKNRNAKPAIIEFNDKDENIPYVKKMNERLFIANYKPSSLYTARKMAHSKQSHKFVARSETRRFRCQNKKIQHARKVRDIKFHEKEFNLFKDQIHHNKFAVQTCSKCQHEHKNTANNKELQKKLKSARDFLQYMRKSHKENYNCSKMQIVFLNNLIRQEQQLIKKECEKLSKHKNNIDTLQSYLDELEFQFNMKTLKQRQHAKDAQHIRDYVKSKLGHENMSRKGKCERIAKKRFKNKSNKNKIKEYNLHNPHKNKMKHIAMPAKTVTITQSDDFILQEIRNKHNNMIDIINDFSPNSISNQEQNIIKTHDKSEENTPILTNFTNKMFQYFLENNSIIGSGLKTLFGFNQNAKTDSNDSSTDTSAHSKDIHELLQESHHLLQTTNDINDPSTIIHNSNLSSQIMSDHKRISD